MNEDPKNAKLGEQIEPPNNPGTYIGKFWRAKNCARLTTLLNPTFQVPVTDANGIVTWLNASVVFGAKGYTVQFPAGYALSSGGGTGAAPQQMKVVSDAGDYLICNSWDGVTQGGTAINIAKPYKLRTLIASEVIAGVTHNYSYTPTYISGSSGPISFYTRTNAYSGTSETETVTPNYLAGDIIYAVPFSTLAPSSLVAVTLADDGRDGRAWAT